MILARVIGLSEYIPQALAWVGFFVSSCLLIGLAFSESRTTFIRKWRMLFAVSTIVGGFGLFWHIRREEQIADSYRRMRSSRDMGRIETSAFIYYSDKNTWPEGDNAAVIAAILAFDTDDPILPVEDLHLSSEGAAVDPWGSPYSMSVSEEEGLKVHSAGPDRIWGTDDDHHR
jgi:hypothetical protein